MTLPMLCSAPSPRAAKRRRHSDAAAAAAAAVTVATAMTSDVKQQTLRLRHLRELAGRSQRPRSLPPHAQIGRPGLVHDGTSEVETKDVAVVQSIGDGDAVALALEYLPDDVRDPLIYPGLYAPSGIDMLQILVRIVSRPNPKITIGAIDSSCALLMCDVRRRDTPIVYYSEPFELLTGYCGDEILGKNCRFLQAPGGQVVAGSRREHTDNRKILEMKNMINAREEIQTTITNYKRDGTAFTNILTIIPLRWESNEVQYIVGFQADKSECYLNV